MFYIFSVNLEITRVFLLGLIQRDGGHGMVLET